MNVFSLEGEYWTVRYEGGAVFRLRDGKGMQYLAYLLHHPGKEIGAAELMTRVSGADRPTEQSVTETQPTPDRRTERARSAVSKRIWSAVQRIQQQDPPLGRHLSLSLKTGRLCGYLPDSMEAPTWSG